MKIEKKAELCTVLCLVECMAIMDMTQKQQISNVS